MRRLPRVGLIVTGGTITSVGIGRVDPLYGESGQSIGADQLLERLPEIRAIGEVVPVLFAPARSSHEMTYADWRALLSVTRAQLEEDRADAVVITHGTNTLEETAYFLDLTVRSERPVVITGAMRPASGLSSDTDINLLNAVRVACASTSRGRGVLVALSDSIHSAREVTKVSTYELDAFQAPDRGPLGHIFADGEVVYHRQPADGHAASLTFDVSERTALPRVDVVVSFLGSDGALIDAAVAAGAAGIVHAGTGGGRATPGEESALLRAIAEGVVVCRSTRAPTGRVMRNPTLSKQGYVIAGDLNPWKSRVLLALALTRTSAADEVQEIFDAA